MVKIKSEKTCSNKKPAFTLVEVMISLIVIMIVTAGAVPVLTKTKPKLEPVTKRGQYACWYNSAGKLQEQYYSERTAITSIKTVNECHLKLDQSPAHFYILASGAGSSSNPGQTVSLYTPALSSELDIKIGKANSNNLITTISSGSATDEIRALGGYNSTNGLSANNIKSCKLLSAQKRCENGKTQKDCEVVEVINGLERTYKIRINGCESDEEYGIQSTDHIIPIEDLQFNTSKTGNVNLTKIASSQRTMLSNANTESYSWGVYKMNFEFKDSSYVPLKNLLGFQNNTSNGLKQVSKMSKIIETMPIRRKSDLTELIKNLNPGAAGKNGAVLILW